MSEYGLNAGIAIGFQNSYGTANVDSLHFVPFLNEDVGIDQPPLISENLTGVFDEAQDFSGPRTVAGNLACDAHPLSIGMMISAVLGVSSTQAADDAFQHAWQPNVADFDIYAANKPVTYYKDLGVGSAMIFQDLIGSTLELAIANGELTKCTVGFMGGQLTQQSAISKALPTGRPRWPWNVASVSIGGSAVPELQALTLTVDQSLEASHTINASLYPSRVKRSGFRTMQVEGTIFFDTQDHYQSFLNETEQNLTVFLKGGEEVASGYTEDMTIILPAFRYREFKPVAEGPTQIAVSFTAAAKYHQNSATGLEIILVNTQAAY